MGRFLALSLSVIGLALLTACGSRQPIVVVPPAPVVTAPPAATAPAATAPVAAPAAALRAGFGRIESMTPVTTAASAGSTAPTSMQRLGIRMEDGTLQVVDTSSPDLAIGDRVELTREGYIRRIPQP